MSTCSTTSRLGAAAFGAALALVVAMPASLASAASPTACVVRNLDTGTSMAKLQSAVTAASAGQRLTVRGTCHGITTIRKNLRIIGVSRATSGRPILDGDDLGSVVTVKRGVTVRITGLTIRDGSSDMGGGVQNHGTLVLRDVIVRGNSASMGGGVLNDPGTLRLYGSSSIRGNTGEYGGGIYNYGTLTMNDSSTIANNTATDGGGVSNGATLTMNDSSAITGNTASTGGGGVWNGGALTVGDSSAITGNTAGAVGGGVYESAGSGALVGVICAPDANANVHDNSPDDCYQDS